MYVPALIIVYFSKETKISSVEKYWWKSAQYVLIVNNDNKIAYYLAGTTGYPDWWSVTGDIQVWRSEDLKTWAPVVQKPRNRTVVWNVVSIGCSQAKC